MPIQTPPYQAGKNFRLKSFRVWLWKTALLGMTAIACQAANIVTNPGFESGTTGWTFGANFFVGSPGNAGSSSAQTGCVGAAALSDPSCEISQILTTTPGSTYFLNFFVSENDGPASEMVIDWDGTQIADVVNPNNCVGCAGASNSPWLQFTFNNLTASGSSTLLQVFGRDDPNTIFFTDFDVDLQGGGGGNGTAPEPASFFLLGAGLVGLGWLGGRRRTPYFSFSRSFSRSSKNLG